MLPFARLNNYKEIKLTQTTTWLIVINIFWLLTPTIFRLVFWIRVKGHSDRGEVTKSIRVINSTSFKWTQINYPPLISTTHEDEYTACYWLKGREEEESSLWRPINKNKLLWRKNETAHLGRTSFIKDNQEMTTNRHTEFTTTQPRNE